MSARQIVVAFDGTDVGEDALAVGGWLAASTGGTALVVDVYADEPVPVLPGIASDFVAELRAGADSVLARARRLVPPSVTAEYLPVAAPSVARGLDRVARQRDAEMIVLGSCHRGVLRRTGIGKTADRLLHGAAVPILVAPRAIRDRELPAASTIGCAYVPTPDGDQALERAVDLAMRTGARLRLYTVVAHGVEASDTDRDRAAESASAARAAMREATEKAVSALPSELGAEVVLLEGGVVDALSTLGPDDCQVLVCGSRGYGPVGRVLLGGVSGRLIRKAMCPVMVVPRCQVESD